MNPDLLTLGLPLGKYIVASALMSVFYWFLFREKTSFNNCRVYLLSIALVGLLISQFNIVVYTPPAQIVEIETTRPPVVLNNTLTKPNAMPTVPVQASVTPTATPETNKYAKLLTVPNIALGIYLAVTCILFLSLLIQLFRILALKRNGKVSTRNGFELVENDEIPTPFSFYRTIFLSPNLTGAKLDMILKHEQWHIKHRHYIDVFMMEILVRLLWFNPVLWWVRRELRNVTEFHADRSVLDEGQELYTYQSIILEEVMENNPYLANGFNNSFTKKRFIMMKNKFNLRYAMLRRVLILPFLIGVFSLLCFTSGQSQVKYKVTSTSKTNKQVKSNSKDTLDATLNSANLTLQDATFTPDTLRANLPNNINISLGAGNISKQQIDKVLNECSVQTEFAIRYLNKLLTNNNLSVKTEDLNLIIKNLGFGGNGSNFGQLPFSNQFLSSITKEDLKGLSNALLEMKTNIDKLKKVESTADKINGFQQQAMSLIQEKFFAKVFSEAMQMSMPKFVSNPPQTYVTRIDNNGSTTTTTTTSKAITTSSELSQEQKERKELNDKIVREARRLKPNEFKVSDIPFTTNSSERRLVSIEKGKNETKVTFAVPILEKEWWVYLSEGLTIVDRQTRDRYIVR